MRIRNVARISLGIGIVIVVLAHAADRLRVPFIDKLEAIIYDARLKATMPRTADTRVAILDIDEKSLSERERGGEGRWPWPRDRMAMLLDTLFTHYEVAVVGFDVVFSERDESSGIRVLESLRETELNNVAEFQQVLEQIKPRLDYDAIFAARMRGRPVVLGYTFVGEKAAKGMLPAPALTSAAFTQGRPRVVRFSGYTSNLAVLQENAASAGHFNSLPDDDGVTRRVPMLAEYQGNYYEPLSLAMLRVVYGAPPVQPLLFNDHQPQGYGVIDALTVGSYRIPVDADGAALIPYRGPRESFPYYSLVDVLHERIPVSDLRGKIVLVGATAPGMFDLRATPIDPVYPGVEIHANLIAGMLDESIKQKPSYSMEVEFIQVLLLGALLAVWLPGLTPQRSTLVTSFAVLSALTLNIVLFQYANLALPIASVLVMILLLFTINMGYGFFVEARSRRQIAGLFGQYVPPQLVDEMATNPEKFSMEGESRDMTVLFTDIRNFTTIAERLEPKVLSEIMKEVLTALTEVIYKHRGTIDKYMGDCVMAFWGAPVADENHARNAVMAALEMQLTMKALQKSFKAKNWPEIRIGIGVNTGRMSVGNMGSRVRLAYTVMGDAVNLGSRLEGITKEYATDILVGEDTKKAVSDIVFREIDRVRVKGRHTALTIFEPLGSPEALTGEKLAEVELFSEAIEHYRRRQWGNAEYRLLNLRKSPCDAHLYDIFLERTAFLRMHPPAADWDGAFTFQSK